jgi:tetratricopeptide (TPR) repeat protein
MFTAWKVGPAILIAITLAVASSRAAGAATPLENGLHALESSDYATAENQLRTASQAGSAANRSSALIGLARVELATGRYPEAAKSAASAAADRGARAEAVAVQAEALARQGKTAEAVSLLEGVKGEAHARRARILLGELYIATGRRSNAQEPLMSIIADYNQNAIQPGDAEGLTLVGRTAHLLRSPRDANDAYNQAEKAGPARVETLLMRADLFLDNYDPGHAEQVVKKALSLAPHNAAAHVAMAEIKFAHALDFTAAEREVEEALAVDAKNARAHYIAAGLAVRSGDLSSADRSLDRGLAVNPSDLALLSTKAAVRFLADDRAGFEKIKQTVFAKNAEYANFYRIVGEFASWQPRHEEIAAMMKEAVQLDPGDVKAWAELGLNLIRTGDEQGGLSALRRAWDKDHFNVRVFNTLNLYEKEVSVSYETVEGTPFRIRYHKEERPILSRYVPALLAEAWTAMVKRYAFTPQAPIFIELYSTKQNFSVRTNGLPNVGVQGVCFGKTIAAMSPRADPANWGQVLWHELAHVFAIQMSKARVPRWFTEGLSEYETIVRRPEWQREEDPSLYGALRAGRIPPVDAFSRAFTHVDDIRDVMTAYYAASQIQVFLGTAFGTAKIPDMLRLWGEGKTTDDVFRRALGITPAEFDMRMRAWLNRRLLRYDTQFVPDTRAPNVDLARANVKKDPTDPRKQVDLALALSARRDLEGADQAVSAALAENPIEPDAHFLRARILRAKRDTNGARQELVGMVRRGHDGYAVRMMLADLATDAKNRDAARFEFHLAHEFDPSMVEPVQALYDLAVHDKREAEALDWLRLAARLDQHDRKTYRLLLEKLIAAGQFKEARAVGESAIFVDVENHAVHSLYANALSQTGAHDRAVFELESALLCNPPRPEAAAIQVRLAKEHAAMGNRAKAKDAQAEALRLDPTNAEASALKIP